VLADIDVIVTGVELDDDTTAEIESVGPKVVRA
jgi:hypothetical protein